MSIEQSLQGLSIYLIGMMGTGKTTVGQLLSQKLNYRFFDTDVLIEKVAQKPITEIFNQEGEPFFRDLETQVLTQVSQCVRSVVATGGGIILKQENWSYLHYGLSIWLNADVDILSERLEEDNSRPLLRKTSLQEQLSLLLEERKSRYREADLRIDITREMTPEDVVNTILEKIPSVLK